MESYRLGRLRFLRPPPAFVELNPASKHVTISFELIVVVQDDYGITIDSVGQLARTSSFTVAGRGKGDIDRVEV